MPRKMRSPLPAWTAALALAAAVANAQPRQLNGGDVATALGYPNAAALLNAIGPQAAPVQSIAGLAGSPSAAQIAAALGGTLGTQLAFGNDGRIVGAIQSTSRGQPGGVAALNASGQIALTIPSADPSGVADSFPAFSALLSVPAQTVIVPPGVFNLSTNVAPPLATLPTGNTSSFGTAYRIDPQAQMPNGYVDAYPAINYQGTQDYSNDLLSIAYGAAFNGRNNMFARATHVECLTTTHCVTNFGQAHANVSGASGFGFNYVAYSEATGSNAQGGEVDIGVLGTGNQTAGGVQNASASGVSIVGAGYGLIGSALQFQTNNLQANFKQGINFNGRSTGGNWLSSLISANGNADPDYLLDFHAATGRVRELFLPSFSVQATPGCPNSRVRVYGSGVGTPIINVEGIPTLDALAQDRVVFSANPSPGEAITINGSTITFVASGATGAQVNIAGWLGDTMTALAVFLNASTDPSLTTQSYQASRNTTLYINAKATGTASNAVAVSTTSTVGVVDTPTMTGGCAAGAAIANAPLQMASLGTGVATLAVGATGDQWRAASGNLSARIGGTAVMQVVTGGHINLTGGSVPTATAGTIASASTDTRGSVALASGVTTTSLSFGTQFTSPEFCTLTGSVSGSVPAISGLTTATLSVTLPSNSAGETVYWHCLQ